MAALGSVNGFVDSRFVWRGGTHAYNGTTLGLTLAALAAGAAVGDEVCDDFSGYRYVLAAEGGGDRTPGGVWAQATR